MSDIEDVTAAADRVEARLPHGVEPERFARYTFEDLISAVDKEKLLEFGRHIV